jgi:hypothetical protein
MELILDDNSKLAFTWIRPGVLSIELYQPGSLRDGHGWLLCGSTVLAGEDLNAFVSTIAGRQQPERRPAT